jgi:hypothetical protein
MNRRAFITMVGGSILAAPLGAEGQQTGKMYRVGYLTGPTGTGTTFFDAFRQGLQELGWKEGQNVAFEHRMSVSEEIPKLARRVNDTCVSKVLERYTPLWEVRHAPTGEPG